MKSGICAWFVVSTHCKSLHPVFADSSGLRKDCITKTLMRLLTKIRYQDSIESRLALKMTSQQQINNAGLSLRCFIVFMKIKAHNRVQMYIYYILWGEASTSRAQAGGLARGNETPMFTRSRVGVLAHCINCIHRSRYWTRPCENKASPTHTYSPSSLRGFSQIEVKML